MNPRNLIPILILIACLGLSPRAQAVSPAPDGGYPGGNTAEGSSALLSLTTGTNNTAAGWFSLKTLTTGQFNTALGAGALFSTATSSLNTATGAAALFRNTNGNSNTANGALSLFSNTTGSNNTALGTNALFDNTTGDFNTAMGLGALENNTTGTGNTAVGGRVLQLNTTGESNTAVGANALSNNTTSDSNTAIGASALGGNMSTGFNTAIGEHALFNNTGAANIAVGFAAGQNRTTGSFNIDIGNDGQAAESSTIRIGQGQTATFIAGIHGATVTGLAVVVNGFGRLGVAPSAARFKDAIKPMDKASEAILALKPVTFRYKKGIDPQGIPQFGLVAEDVEAVNPDLVVRDKEGKVNTVRYEAINAMLLNEFLKAHAKLQLQQATIDKQQKQIQALTTGLQKVSDQRELNMPSLRTADNH